jgi:hypothetical protein
MNHEQMLREVLETEADRVQVRPDGLTEIRRRVAARRLWTRPAFIAGGAAAALAGTVAVVVVATGALRPTTQVTPPRPGGSVTTAPVPDPLVPAPTVPPVGPSSRERPPTRPGSGVPLAVYYVGLDRFTREDRREVIRPRLYREFQRLQPRDGGPAERTRAAVAEMLRGRAADPNYDNWWPVSARVRDVRVAGDVVTVDLAGAATSPVDAETARFAVQQLVWTATAASALPRVRLLLDGAPVARLWGLVDTAQPMRRGAAIDLLAPVWLIAPQEGDVVGRTVEVHVAGTVFEATAHLRVRHGRTVVYDQPVLLDAGPPAQGEATVRLRLAPGSYVIEAYEVSMVDGATQHLDDHTVTVR